MPFSARVLPINIICTFDNKHLFYCAIKRLFTVLSLGIITSCLFGRTAIKYAADVLMHTNCKWCMLVWKFTFFIENESLYVSNIEKINMVCANCSKSLDLIFNTLLRCFWETKGNT